MIFRYGDTKIWLLMAWQRSGWAFVGGFVWGDGGVLTEARAEELREAMRSIGIKQLPLQSEKIYQKRLQLYCCRPKKQPIY